SYIISTVVLLCIVLRFVAMHVYGTKRLTFDQMTKLLSFQKVKYEKSVDTPKKEELIDLNERLDYTIKYLDNKTILSEKEEIMKTDLNKFKQDLNKAKNEKEHTKIIENLKEYFNKIHNKN
ncbi:hypothetical protein, partial [Clostridium tarantellae]|uniref:hypothetical protein n=1 Tax=Clostridium tarantellae TaxID=39493 RepID=UPI001478696F